MTTIAIKDGVIAADTRMTGGFGLKRSTHKIHDCGAYYFGGAGDVDSIALIAEWLAGGALPSARPRLEDGGCHGFVVMKGTGHVYVVEGKAPTLCEVTDPYHATGTGRDFAIAAMSLGQSAADAVRFAMQFDVFTGGEIDEVKFTPRVA